MYAREETTIGRKNKDCLGYQFSAKWHLLKSPEHKVVTGKRPGGEPGGWIRRKPVDSRGISKVGPFCWI